MAEAFTRAAQRHGPEAVWPYFYAGTMGLVQRDGIHRLRHAMRYSRQLDTICVALSDAGWLAGVGRQARRRSRARSRESDLIVVWGGNPVSTQVNVMTHIARARKERGAKLVVVDPYRTGTAEVADMHLMLRPGTDGALACGVMHVLFKEGYRRPRLHGEYTDVPAELEAHLQSRTPEWAEAHHRRAGGADRRLRPALWPHQAQLHPRRLRLLALAQRLGQSACRHLPADGDRRLAVSRRRRALQQWRRSIKLEQDR